jgi:hypothetical protein
MVPRRHALSPPNTDQAVSVSWRLQLNSPGGPRYRCQPIDLVDTYCSVLLYVLMLILFTHPPVLVASIEPRGHLGVFLQIHRYFRVTIFGRRPYLVFDSSGCKCSAAVSVRKMGYPIVSRCLLPFRVRSRMVWIFDIGDSRTAQVISSPFHVILSGLV